MKSKFTARFRALIATTLAAALIAPTSPALAARYGSDRIGGVPLSQGTVAWTSAPDVAMPEGIVIDASTGRALWARSANTQRAMASTTKMMTALLTLQRGGLDKTATVSRRASNVEYGIGLHAGERLKVRKLLELALVASSNDAAFTLGEYGGNGNMGAFVGKMNAQARALGMTHTHYVNPHGLDASGHYSSAADLTKVARALMRYPEARRIMTMRSVILPKASGRPARKLKATDELLGVYWGLNGVKTGFTDKAGYCFVGSAQRNGVWLMTVVMGTPNDSQRFVQTARLLDWGFRHYKRRTLASRNATVALVPTAADPTRNILTRFDTTVTANVFDFDGAISRSTSLPVRQTLPVYARQPIGTVTFSQGTRKLAQASAVSAGSLGSVGETVAVLPMSNYPEHSVVARASSVTTVPPFDPKTALHRTVVLPSSVAAPVTKGDRLGEIVYSQQRRVILRVPVFADNSVEAPGFLDVLAMSLARGWRTLIGANRPTASTVAER